MIDCSVTCSSLACLYRDTGQTVYCSSTVWDAALLTWRFNGLKDNTMFN